MSTELERMLKAAQACGPFRARITAPRFELSNTILAKIRKALEAGGAGTSYAGVFSFTTDVTIAGTLTAGTISAGSVAYSGMTTDDLSVDSAASIQLLRVSGLMRFAGAVSDSASSIATLNVGTLGVSGLSTLAGVVSNSAASLATLNVGTFGVSGLSTLAGVVSDSAVSLANLTVGTLTAATFSPPPTGDLVVASTASIQRLNVADGSFFADIVGDSTASLQVLTVAGLSTFAGLQSASMASVANLTVDIVFCGGFVANSNVSVAGTVRATSVAAGTGGFISTSGITVGALASLNKGVICASTASLGGLTVSNDAQFNTLTATGLATFAGLQSASQCSVGALTAGTLTASSTVQFSGSDFLVSSLSKMRGIVSVSTASIRTLVVSDFSTLAGLQSASGCSLARITTNRLRTGYSDVSAAWIPQFDAAAGNFFRYTAVSDVSTFSIANSVTGDRVTIVWAQSGGAFKIDVWPTAVLCPETTTPSLAIDGRCDVLTFLKINSTPDQWVFAQSGWYDN